MNANKFERSQCRLWSAHYTGLRTSAARRRARHVTPRATGRSSLTGRTTARLTSRPFGVDTPSFTKPAAAKAAAAPAAPAVTLAEVKTDLFQIESYVKAHPQ